jgi:hypothetical protein
MSRESYFERRAEDVSISTGRKTIRSPRGGPAPSACGFADTELPASHPFAQHEPSLLFRPASVRTPCRATNDTHAITRSRTRRCCSQMDIVNCSSRVAATKLLASYLTPVIPSAARDLGVEHHLTPRSLGLPRDDIRCSRKLTALCQITVPAPETSRGL